MSSAFIIRKLVTSDINALLLLYENVYKTTNSMVKSWIEQCPDQETFCAELRTLINNPDGLFLAAATETQLLGYISIQPRSPARLRHTADLSMGLHANARGKGVGRQLLQFALNQATHHSSLEIIYLMVRADNTSAIKLYQTNGFKIITTLEKDTKVGDQYFDGVLMSYWLTKY
ncbi:GNAT family N-acetyltransferase [Chitinivorax sp. B]|uniref:GNAT family N-acetyltransferase n=1 Tax=Chitinivorax sp. B TaxID=2502235 RepID=UPI0010F65D8F|nr:GNAT family N-acetyltransferase [Chitinivorax sp. B]